MSNEYNLEREAWAEQQYEAKANGMGGESFENWQKRQKLIRAFFEREKAAKES